MIASPRSMPWFAAALACLLCGALCPALPGNDPPAEKTRTFAEVEEYGTELKLGTDVLAVLDANVVVEILKRTGEWTWVEAFVQNEKRRLVPLPPSGGTVIPINGYDLGERPRLVWRQRGWVKTARLSEQTPQAELRDRWLAREVLREANGTSYAPNGLIRGNASAGSASITKSNERLDAYRAKLENAAAEAPAELRAVGVVASDQRSGGTERAARTLEADRRAREVTGSRLLTPKLAIVADRMWAGNFDGAIEEGVAGLADAATTDPFPQRDVYAFAAVLHRAVRYRDGGAPGNGLTWTLYQTARGNFEEVQLRSWLYGGPNEPGVEPKVLDFDRMGRNSQWPGGPDSSEILERVMWDAFAENGQWVDPDSADPYYRRVAGQATPIQAEFRRAMLRQALAARNPHEPLRLMYGVAFEAVDPAGQARIREVIRTLDAIPQADTTALRFAIARAIRDLGFEAEAKRVADFAEAHAAPSSLASRDLLFLRAHDRLDRGDLVGAEEQLRRLESLADLAAGSRLRVAALRGRLDLLAGRTAAARKNLSQTVETALARHGWGHPLTAELFRDRALAERADGDEEAAAATFETLASRGRRHAGMTHESRWLEVFDIRRNGSLAAALDTADRPGVAERSLEWLLNRRAEEYHAAEQDPRLSADRGGEADFDILHFALSENPLPEGTAPPERFWNVQPTLRRIRDWYLAPPSLAPPDDAATVERLWGEQERHLRRTSVAQRPDEPGWNTLAEVRRAIAPGQALIEFAHVQSPRLGARIPEDQYAAWVIPAPDAGPVVLLDLGPADSLIDAVDAFTAGLQTPRSMQTAARRIEFAEASATLRDRFVAPLLSALPPSTTSLLITPDEQLWQFPLAALPDPGATLEDGDAPPLIARFQIDYMFGGHLLTRKPVEVEAGPPLILAAPNFERNHTEQTQIALRDRPRPLPIVTPLIKGYARLGLSVRPLPGTAAEADAVVGPMRRLTGVPPVDLRGDRASVSLARAHERPEYLLAATHAFAFSHRNLLVASRTDADLPALRRCGMLLAGANYSIWEQEEVAVVREGREGATSISNNSERQERVRTSNRLDYFRSLLVRDAARRGALTLAEIPGDWRTFVRGVIDRTPAVVTDRALASVQREAEAEEESLARRLGRMPPLEVGARLLQGKPIPPGTITEINYEKAGGLLLGEEIARLWDLRGTKLAVLSACDTSRGDLRSSGEQASLRFAFHAAGAQDVAATLWRIPDAETTQLVADLFERIAAGEAHGEALRTAQLNQIARMRAAGREPDPYFWAAFTLTRTGR